MTDYLKKFIRDNKELIETNDFSALYSKIDAKNTSALTDTLYTAGIDPLNYLEFIPMHFANSLDKTHFDVGENILEVHEWGFSRSTIQEINLTSAKQIKHDAFRHCEQLESAVLKSAMYLMHDAFVNCKNLKKVYCPNIINLYAGAFRGCTSLEQVKLGVTLQEVENRVFSDCIKLHQITYEGTIADWSKVTLHDNWISHPVTIVCSDGEVNYTP